MPARDRTDAVDWSAVEALVSEVLNAALTGERRILFEQRDIAPATHALAAVRLVRALEEGNVRRIVRWIDLDGSGPWYEVAVYETNETVGASTPLAAVQRALDASKGEG